MKTYMTIVILAALLGLSHCAQCAGPDEPPTGVPGTSRTLTTSPSYAGASETTISGLVVGAGATPLHDVAVKLYVGGVLAAETLTSLDGNFEMTRLIDYARDVTIDLWFVASDESLLMENVILKESSAALAHSLYSPCLKRATLAPITDVVVRLSDVEGRTDRLKRSDCLE